MEFSSLPLDLQRYIMLSSGSGMGRLACTCKAMCELVRSEVCLVSLVYHVSNFALTVAANRVKHGYKGRGMGTGTGNSKTYVAYSYGSLKVRHKGKIVVRHKVSPCGNTIIMYLHTQWVVIVVHVTIGVNGFKYFSIDINNKSIRNIFSFESALQINNEYKSLSPLLAPQMAILMTVFDHTYIDNFIQFE